MPRATVMPNEMHYVAALSDNGASSSPLGEQDLFSQPSQSEWESESESESESASASETETETQTETVESDDNASNASSDATRLQNSQLFEVNTQVDYKVGTTAATDDDNNNNDYNHKLNASNAENNVKSTNLSFDAKQAACLLLKSSSCKTICISDDKLTRRRRGSMTKSAARSRATTHEAALVQIAHTAPYEAAATSAKEAAASIVVEATSTTKSAKQAVAAGTNAEISDVKLDEQVNKSLKRLTKSSTVAGLAIRQANNQQQQQQQHQQSKLFRTIGEPIRGINTSALSAAGLAVVAAAARYGANRLTKSTANISIVSCKSASHLAPVCASSSSSGGSQLVAARPECVKTSMTFGDVPMVRDVNKQQQQQHSMNSSVLNSHKGSITIDTSKARSNAEVLRMCIGELGWQECAHGLANAACDIIWQSCTSHEGEQNVNVHYSAHSRLNKFPCMNLLLRKGPLTQSLNVMRTLYASQYNFYPRTWFLPEQFAEFQADCKYMHERETRKGQPLTTFIVKPNDGSQGDGIYLIRNPDEYARVYLGHTHHHQPNQPQQQQQQQQQHEQQYKKAASSKSFIVQEYIHNPFLIDGLKSDLRIYVLILSLKPLEIHICDEGLVRFATVNYELPDDHNLKQIFMHLTNYSLNKRNEAYRFTSSSAESAISTPFSSSANAASTTTAATAADAAANAAHAETNGSKRKLSRVFNHIATKGYNVAKLKAAIDDLVVKTVIALVPEMKVECAFEAATHSIQKQRPAYFQILGFDILLKDDLKPILLEVNCNPSLRVDYELEAKEGKALTLPSPIDIDIKRPLVLETLKLVAPRKKLDLIEKAKRDEENQERATRLRQFIVQQRIEERLLTAQKLSKFDINKCPLLSKPGELYKRRLRQQSFSQLVSLNPSGGSTQRLAAAATAQSLLASSSSTSAADNAISNSSSSNSNSNSSSQSQLNSSDALEAQKVQYQTAFKSFQGAAVNHKNNNANSGSSGGSNKNSSNSCLRNIYPNRHKPSYGQLFVHEHIADIFLYFTLATTPAKTMSHDDFRSFVKKCRLINRLLTADNLDIIYCDLNRKWELYNKRKPDPNGLCYQGFVECFVKLSRLIFDEINLEQSIKSLVSYCKYFLQDNGVSGSNSNSNGGGGGSNSVSISSAKSNGSAAVWLYYDQAPSELLNPLSERLLAAIEYTEELLSASSMAVSNVPLSSTMTTAAAATTTTTMTKATVALLRGIESLRCINYLTTTLDGSSTLPTVGESTIDDSNGITHVHLIAPRKAKCESFSGFDKRSKSKQSLFPIFFDTTS